MLYPMICNEVFLIDWLRFHEAITKIKSNIEVHFILLGKILISSSKIQPKTGIIHLSAT